MNLKTSLLPIAAAAVFLPVTLSADDNDNKIIGIYDNWQLLARTSENQDVKVYGDFNVITIKGPCHCLTIYGKSNTVIVETTVEGIKFTDTSRHNEVRLKKDPNSKNPEVTDSQGNITHPGN